MDLLPTGSKSDLIFIETELFKLHIRGKQGNRKSDAISANLNVPAHIRVDYYGGDTAIVKTLASSGEMVVNEGYMMMPCFYEEGIYEMLLINKSDIHLEVYHDSNEIKNSFNTLENIIFGSFSFDGEIGYTTFEIISGSKKLLALTIEVFPAKMDYKSDYTNMINEVNEEIASLAFEFMGKTYQSASLKNVKYQTASEFYHILEKVYTRFNEALKRIERSPKHSIVTTERVASSNKAKHISKNNTAYLRKHPEVLYKNDKGVNIKGIKYLPQYVMELKKETTVDIYENRFVKYILKCILRRIKTIKQRILKNYGTDNGYYNVLCNFERELNSYLNRFFSNIGEIQGKRSMSLVFQMAPGYREVFYYYMLLKKGLSLSDELYSITPKKIWKLYEIWCYIKLHNILKDLGYEVVHYGIIKAVDQGLYLTLVQDEHAVMKYKNNEGQILELFYNRSYNNLKTTNQRPDTVLYIKKNGKDKRMYIFDAKYRLTVENEDSIGPMEDDINVMHRYRDAIVSELDNGLQFKYDTFGAYVMFPYSDEETYRNHRFYKSIDTVNIGAFPMLPGSTSLITKHLLSLLQESTIEASQKLITHGEYDDYAKFKLENVMVANIKDAKHIKVYVENKFFHIPTKTLSHVRPGIEYIAFYGSKDKFEEAGGITCYGKIKNYKVYSRDECIELPKNSKESYIRFEFEDIKEIGPIRTVEYGLQTVMYTTMYLLCNAENVHELKMKSSEEIVLYKRLKEISEKAGRKLQRFREYYLLGDVKVELLENKDLRINGEVNKFKDGIIKIARLY